MTNDPTYDEQLALLQAGLLPSQQRHAAARQRQRRRQVSARRLLLGLAPEPASERQAVASVMAIMRNVSVPFGAPYERFGVYNTEYRTVCDTTNRLYVFELTTSPSLIWVRMSGLDLAEGAPRWRSTPTTNRWQAMSRSVSRPTTSVSDHGF